jgi:hypothetical protein
MALIPISQKKKRLPFCPPNVYTSYGYIYTAVSLYWGRDEEAVGRLLVKGKGKKKALIRRYGMWEETGGRIKRYNIFLPSSLTMYHWIEQIGKAFSPYFHLSN